MCSVIYETKKKAKQTKKKTKTKITLKQTL